jgi:hypothetical protein
MMVQYFIKDSTDRVNFELNNIPPGLNGEKEPKNKKMLING